MDYKMKDGLHRCLSPMYHVFGYVCLFNTSVKIYRTKKLNNGSRVTGSAI